MRVKSVYQDDRGQWHIEYSPDHLMGLAFRVYIGQLIIAIFVALPLALLIGIASAKSLHEEKNTALPSNYSVRQESISNELYN